MDTDPPYLRLGVTYAPKFADPPTLPTYVDADCIKTYYDSHTIAKFRHFRPKSEIKKVLKFGRNMYVLFYTKSTYTKSLLSC